MGGSPSIPSSCQITRKGAARARTGHPWIYRDDVVSIDAADGDVVVEQDDHVPSGETAAPVDETGEIEGYVGPKHTVRA